MTSGQIVALEFLGVIGVVLGLGVWELVRLRRSMRAAPPPPIDQGADVKRPSS